VRVSDEVRDTEKWGKLKEGDFEAGSREV